MLPTVSLFGFSVQSMWLMCLAGAGICCAFVLPRSRRMALPGVDITNAGAMGLYRHSGRGKAFIPAHYRASVGSKLASALCRRPRCLQR